jgi:hypothetical protein
MYSLFILGEQERIVVYLDGLYPDGLLRDRQAKVNALRVLQSPSLHFGDCRFAACAIREWGGVAPVLWADVDAVRAG